MESEQSSCSHSRCLAPTRSSPRRPRGPSCHPPTASPPRCARTAPRAPVSAGARRSPPRSSSAWACYRPSRPRSRRLRNPPRTTRCGRTPPSRARCKSPKRCPIRLPAEPARVPSKTAGRHRPCRPFQFDRRRDTVCQCTRRGANPRPRPTWSRQRGG
ncbi:hypothetical protein T492DRAFT_1030323 [Pavlovales sp. CCMP2436]|nr:hypothetical protein T492DRAFT_1030323 [Pavlovales sp. CCMP2436]